MKDFFFQRKFLTWIFISRSEAREAGLNVHSVRLFRVALAPSRYVAVAALDIQKIRTGRSREIGAQHPRAKLNIPPSIFPRASRRILSSSSRPATAKKEVKQTREGRRREERARGAQAAAIGNPTAPRPMPRRLYRFTTERRTSVNRYLLTLDFPWPPPRARPLPLSRPLVAAIPTAALLSTPSPPPCRVSFSRISLRGSARPPLSFFRPSAPRRRPPFFGRSVSARGASGRQGVGGR